jgi:hypothetical protein
LEKFDLPLHVYAMKEDAEGKMDEKTSIIIQNFITEDLMQFIRWRIEDNNITNCVDEALRNSCYTVLLWMLC